MTSYGSIEIVNTSIAQVFSNTRDYDMALYTEGSNQSIHIGCGYDLGSNATLVVSKSNLVVNGAILPGSNLAYDLGSSNMRFRDLYISGNTIDMAGTKITVDGSNNVRFADTANNLKRLVVNEIQIGDESAGGALRLKKDAVNGGFKFFDVAAPGATEVSSSNIAVGSSSGGSGSSSGGNVSSNAHFVPASNNTYDLGAATMRWRNLYLSGNAISFGDGTSINSVNWQSILNYVAPTINNSTPVITRKLFKGAAQDHSGFVQDGQLYMFGNNDCGQLGMGNTSNNYPLPTIVPTFSNASIVAVGQQFTVVGLTNGQVYGFGANTNGQIGQSSTSSNYTLPVQIAALSNIIDLAAGISHSLFMDSSSNVYALGNNAKGQVAAASYNTVNSNVGQVALPGPAAQVFAGAQHSLVVMKNGSAVVFGDNSFGQLGVSSNVTSFTNVPGAVATMSNIVNGGCGENHTGLIMLDGTTYTFGNNSSGQLGTGNTTAVTGPQKIINAISGSNGALMQFDAGLNHTAILMNDASIRVFGDNTYGQVGAGTNTQVLSVTNTLAGYTGVQIACGRNHTLFTIANNTLLDPNLNRTFAMGNNNKGQIGDNTFNPNNVLTQKRLVATRIYEGTFIYRKALFVGCRPYTSSYIDQDGVLYMTGYNYYGQLGDSTTSDKSVFAPLTFFTQRIISIACGYNHTVALDSAGQVYAWGRNYYGTLGNSTFDDKNTPVNISTITGSALLNKTIIGVACGINHTIAFDSAGQVYAWGLNNVGQLGNSTTGSGVYINTPVNISTITGSAINGKTIVGIACGGNHTIALDSAGQVYAWGYNSNGQLGNSTTGSGGSGTDKNTPVNISTITGSAINGKTIVGIAGGNEYTIALDSAGQVYAWGVNGSGQLGTSTSNDYKNTPVNISTITGSAINGKTIVGIACGYYHTIALDSAGQVYAWGYGGNGQLGNSTNVQKNTPVNISTITGSAINGKTIVGIACGDSHTLALDSAGQVYACGYNSNGQLGNSTFDQKNTPVAITLTNRDLASKILSDGLGRHKIFMNRNANKAIVSTVGDNTNKQLGDGTSVTSRNYLSDLTAFSANVVASHAGPSHSAVVLSDGTVYLWGKNNMGQCGQTASGTDIATPTILTGVANAKDVRCGADFTIIELADDTLISFGNNANGCLGVSSVATNTNARQTISLTSVQFFDVGTNHVAVIAKLNGSGANTLYMWGANANGKTGQEVTAGSLNTPTAISASAFGNYTPVKVACGDNHTVVTTSDRSLYTIGLNQSGQLGVSTNFATTTPVLTWSKVDLGVPFTPVNVRCGLNHTIVMLANNTIRTFGANANTQLGTTGANTYTPFAPTVDPAYPPLNISGGENNTYAELSDGRVNAYGVYNSYVMGAKLMSYQKFSNAYMSGGSFNNYSVVISKMGQVYAWGLNEYGQLGNSTNGVGTDKNTPVNISAITGSAINRKTIVGIACGSSHTMALDSTGQVYAWGNGGNGQLGNSTNGTKNTPVNISTITDSAINGKTIVGIVCGSYYTIAFDSAGQVYAWGSNGNGQLGNSTIDTKNAPVNISTITGSAINGKTIVGVTCGWSHTIALALDSAGQCQVYAWGNNGSGQLGNSTFDTKNAPINISTITGSAINGKTIVGIACGDAHTLAFDSAGQVYAWGGNLYGQLGNSTSGSGTEKNTPVNISTITGSAINQKIIVGIACGSYHTIALDSAGQVYAWGNNGSGQLGNSTFDTKNTPVNISTITGSAINGKTIVGIACGSSHTIALDSAGQVYAWGNNGVGQLGNSTSGSGTNLKFPIAISLGSAGTGTTPMFINFTGQHRCFVSDMDPLAMQQYQGRLVVTDKNKYITNFMSGSSAITINDSLPQVSLSSKPYDKRVFGVLSMQRNDNPLSEVELMELRQAGDTRAEINAVGEGGIWICDENGPVEAGDLIVTSSILGYGMKQMDDLFRSITAAKATIDCDFTAPLQPKMQIRVDAYGNKVLDESGSPIWDAIMTDTRTTTDADGKPVTETIDPPVPVMEPLYEMRYLLHDATEITKEEYESRKAANELVYRAAFIGCTYHCG